jgi:hypothetical protein
MELTLNIFRWVDAVTPPASLTVDTGGISIDGTTNIINDSSLAVTVADDSEIEISVSQTGYHPYSLTISNVYRTDASVDILMVPIITDISDPEYLMPHAFFFTLTDICSFDVGVYNASSYAGNIEWYLNNELLLQSNNESLIYAFTSEGDYQFKQAVSTTTYDGNSVVTAWLRQWASSTVGETGNTTITQDVSTTDLAAYLLLDLETNVTVSEYRPTFVLTKTPPVEIIDNADCYTQYEDITVTADAELTRSGAVSSEYNVAWTVTSPSGFIVLEETQSLQLAVNSVTFSMDELGTYTVSADLIDVPCNNTFNRTTTAATCDFVFFETTGDCGDFTLYNRSLQYDIDYEIELVGGSGESPISGTLAATPNSVLGNSEIIELTDIGIHQATISWYTDISDPTTYQTKVLVINNWCSLWDCLAGYINEVLCKPEELCSPCPDGLVLNEMLLLNQAYSMLMNNEYTFNNYYSALDESKLAEYATINSVADKIEKLCARLDCKSPCISVTQKSTKFSFGIKGNSCSCKGSGCSNCK